MIFREEICCEISTKAYNDWSVNWLLFNWIFYKLLNLELFLANMVNEPSVNWLLFKSIFVLLPNDIPS